MKVNHQLYIFFVVSILVGCSSNSGMSNTETEPSNQISKNIEESWPNNNDIFLESLTFKVDKINLLHPKDSSKNEEHLLLIFWDEESKSLGVAGASIKNPKKQFRVLLKNYSIPVRQEKRRALLDVESKKTIPYGSLDIKPIINIEVRKPSKAHYLLINDMMFKISQNQRFPEKVIESYFKTKQQNEPFISDKNFQWDIKYIQPKKGIFNSLFSFK